MGHAAHTCTYKPEATVHTHICASTPLTANMGVNTCPLPLHTHANPTHTLLPAGAVGGRMTWWAPTTVCSGTVLHLHTALDSSPVHAEIFKVQCWILEMRGSLGRCRWGDLSCFCHCSAGSKLDSTGYVHIGKQTDSGCSFCLQLSSPGWKGNGIWVFSGW